MKKDKTPTAEEFRKKLLKERGRVSESDFMIKFAELHVQAALEAAYKKAFAYYDSEEGDNDTITYNVDEDSILNSYSFKKIK